MRRLRPPAARAPFIAFSYAREGRANAGVTFKLPAGEQAVAPGAGRVVAVAQRWAAWQHSPGDLSTKHSYEITIDHGSGVWTVVGGLLVLADGARQGLNINRGDTLGTLVTDECFFQVAVNRTVQNPLKVNRHFSLTDAKYVPGRQRYLRAAADLFLRTLDAGVHEALVSGRHFFENIRQRWSLTINVDFNGDGTKTGIGAVGGLNDYWNVYAAGAFNQTYNSSFGYYYYYYYGCTGYTFNTTPQMWLNDARNIKSPVWLERVANATAAHGQSVWFDPMLSTYIGGNGEENFFAVRGLPRGTYQLYVYGNDGTVPNTTTVYVAVDDALPEVKQTNPTGVPAFVENANYVRFQVVVSSGSTVSVKVYGYLAGLQLIRT